MTIELPTTKDERVVFWTEDSEDAGGEPSRGVLTSDGEGAWTMDFEIGYEYQNEDPEDGLAWEDGGVFRPRDAARFCLDLARAFTDCNRGVSGIIEVMAKGTAEYPIRKPVIFTRVTGSKRFKVTLNSVGDDSYGHPLMQIEQTRALTAEEWFVVCKRFAQASDWWTDRMGDDA